MTRSILERYYLVILTAQRFCFSCKQYFYLMAQFLKLSNKIPDEIPHLMYSYHF
jgi:hypothetical protein